MHDPVGHQSRNVSICQAVKNVLTLASGSHDPFTFEYSQTLRDGWQRFIQGLGKFRHTARFRFEHDQQLQSLWIAQGAKNGCRPFTGGFVKFHGKMIVVAAEAAGRIIFGGFVGGGTSFGHGFTVAGLCNRTIIRS